MELEGSREDFDPARRRNIRKGFRRCPRCSKIVPTSYKKCWYCKWEPWYIRHSWLTILVLGLLAVLLILLYNKK